MSSLNESDAILFSERITLASQILNAAFYGIHFTVFLLCFASLSKKSQRVQKAYFFLTYISICFILATMSIVTSSLTMQHAFIDDRNIFGDPAGYLVRVYSHSFEHVDDICGLVGTFLTDGLLLWRGLIIYRGSGWVGVMVLPGLMFLGYSATSIYYVVDTLRHNVTLSSGFNALIPCIVLSQGFNIVVSTLIIARLLIQRQKVIKLLGPQCNQHSTQRYVSIVAMMVESASLSSFFGVLFFITYGLKSSTQIIMIAVLSRAVLISPLLIIYRVAQGQAWTDKTLSVITTSQITAELGTRISNAIQNTEQTGQGHVTRWATSRYPSDQDCSTEGSFPSVSTSRERIDEKV